MRQRTGSSSRKVLLLVLANYADDLGICWPSQKTLQVETEMSVDTIQRQSKVLQEMGLIRITRRRRKDGTWPALLYQLDLSSTAHAIPHGAANHAAMTTLTIPQSLRHKPSSESSSKSSAPKQRKASVRERLLAWQRKQVGNEVIQNRIAKRLGDKGWELLFEISTDDLQKITDLEREGRLGDDMIEMIRLRVRNGVRGVA
ncbi:helix-turn-helix domain-containing protein [Bradyrhizobium sp. RDT46]|uniref:helix-turn-helix domain-containing protein n=1 Tax=Bradyrhizobium sp. RDT46 TaxID=3341829 RepID=UPI0035C677F5